MVEQSRETPAAHRSGETVGTKLLRIAAKAHKEGRFKFTSLYHLMNEELLLECFQRLSANKAAGIDEVTKGEYAENLETNIEVLIGRLHRMAYRPQPPRRVYIPKPGSDKQRPLGIPCLEDKLVQSALARILGAIYEEDFIEGSYGFRPGRSCHDALRALSQAVEWEGTNYIAEADIKGFFDNVDHEWLMKMLEQRIADKRVLRLIKGFLKSGVMESGEMRASEEGVPQGGSISPVLANVYLHYALDLWFEKVYGKSCKGKTRLIRYADDFVVCFVSQEDAMRFKAELAERLKKFGLEVEPTKTKVLEFGRDAERHARTRGVKPETFDFLGFTHYCSRTKDGSRFRMKRVTSRKKFRAKLAAIKEWLKQKRIMPTQWIMRVIGLKLRGHYQKPTNRIQSVNNGSFANYFYTYDAVGNVTNDGVHTYTYDGANRLVSVDGGTTAQYAYDQNNRRYKKTVGSAVTHYVWEGSQVVSEHDGTGALLADYIYSGNRMIAKSVSGVLQYFLSDRLSARLVLDITGNVAGRMAHLPFGDDFAESGTQEKHHFTSYERDGESGTDYAVNRQYSLGVGRFMRVDPFDGSNDISNPKSLNRYAYVLNDPVNAGDPLGRSPSLIDLGGGSFAYRICFSFGEMGWCEWRVYTEYEPRGAEQRRPQQWHVERSKLAECVEALYGVTLKSFTESTAARNGEFVGFGPDALDPTNPGNNARIEITNDTRSFTSSGLAQLYNQLRTNNPGWGWPPLPKGTIITGFTNPFDPHQTWSARNLSQLERLKTQVHEIGHALDMITGIEQNPKAPGDEQGFKLEKCVKDKGGFVLQ